MISVNFGICLVTICMEYKYILKGIPLTIPLVSCILLPFFLRPFCVLISSGAPTSDLKKKKGGKKRTSEGNRSCLEKKPTWVQPGTRHSPCPKFQAHYPKLLLTAELLVTPALMHARFSFRFCCIILVFFLFFWPTVFGQQEMADIRPAGTCLCCFAVILCSTLGQEMRQKNAFAVSMEFSCIHD